MIAYGEKTSLYANDGTNAHNIYEIAITTAILIGRLRIANLPNFFSNLAKKLKSDFPHFHSTYPLYYGAVHTDTYLYHSFKD